MKNEGPFILEWVAYHLLIGFDRFVIYTNDCTDLTAEIAKRLSDLGYGLHLENPKVGSQRPQAVAMRDMFRHDLVRRADWVLFSDCDEFLKINVGKGHLDDLLSTSEDLECISVMWRLFGDSGIRDYDDQPVTEKFIHAAPVERPVSVNAWGFKSMFKPTENIDRLGAHRPFYKDISTIKGKWIASSGEHVSDGLVNAGWRFTLGNGGYALAQLNHYAVRSVDSFIVKCERGHVLHTNKQIDLTYHKGMNHNQQKDAAMLQWKGPITDMIARLRSDPVLNDLHLRSVQHHTTAAKQLREKHNVLYAELCRIAAVTRSVL